MNSTKKHTFVVLAYKNSPYLPQCIESLLNQECMSNIIIATSTPNEWIKSQSVKYNIDLKINDSGKFGIANDWNFAYQQANTELVTLAHQDDIYNKNYLTKILSKYNECKDALIIFTNYYEIRDGKIISDNKNLSIKRTMLKPLLDQKKNHSKFWKRLCISFGNPICCPSVTYCKNKLPINIFQGDMGSNIDWLAWEKISKLDGPFVYINDVLINHRIHSESTTSKLIDNSDRSKEDLYMLEKFWPDCIAKVIEHYYKSAESSNHIS